MNDISTMDPLSNNHDTELNVSKKGSRESIVSSKDDNHDPADENRNTNELCENGSADHDVRQCSQLLNVKENELADSTATNNAENKPKCCAIMHLFLVNYCFLSLFYMGQNIYNIGVIRTLERKFGLSSAQSGVIMSMNDISHIMVVIFVGYFGKRAHKPKVLSISLLLVAFAALIMASPKLFFDDSNSSSSPERETTTVRNPFGSNNTLEETDKTLCRVGEAETCDADDIERDSTNQAAYLTFLAAQFLAGLGGSGITTLGLAYIDENSEKHSSALHLGIVSSVYAFGPVAGLGLSAITLRLPESLGSDPTNEPGDVDWIGCWWLGYVITSICITVCCIPMWFFPKDIINQPKTTEQKDTEEQSVKEQLKDFPREMLSLFKNAPYMVFVLMTIMLAYVLYGLYVQMPRYVEVHFHQPAYKSSYLAVTGAISGIIGGVAGGYFMKRKKIGPYGSAKVLCGVFSFIFLGILVIMFLACPQLEMAGEWQDNGQLSLALPCNQNCTCSVTKEAYKPTCGEDGLTYFSACHAGCTTLANGTYDDCGCIVDPKSPDALGSASQGQCPISCNLLIPYIIVIFFTSLVGNLGRTPATILQLRIVESEQRAFALGFTSFALNLLAFIPAPVLFGTLIDSTCILWQTTCSASGTGSCLLYDTNAFRLITHGISLLFKALAIICAFVICFLLRRKIQKDDSIIVDVKADEAGSTEEKISMKIANHEQDEMGSTEDKLVLKVANHGVDEAV